MAKIGLPDRLLVTPEPCGDIDGFCRHLDLRLARGDIAVIQLRSPGLAAADYLLLAVRVERLCRARGVALLLNADPGVAFSCGADGAHLNRARLFSFSGERPAGLLLSAAAHDLEAVARADKIGVDFMFVSPVAPTATHPGAPALGWDGFARLAAAATAPVYALGGMTVADIPAARAHGGEGIAAITALWEDGEA